MNVQVPKIKPVSGSLAQAIVEEPVKKAKAEMVVESSDEDDDSEVAELF